MEPIKIPCVFMRTGTSKALYFKKEDLPADPALRDQYLLAAIGSPDVRQIDGMGGGDVSLSKIALISKSTSPEYDIEYTFGQVSLTAKSIDYSGNCGNCSSGAGPFAIDEGLVEAVEPETFIRVLNTNTNKVLYKTVRVKDGKAVVAGDYQIDGVPGTAAPIDLDFKETVGSTNGALLPTGNLRDILTVPALGDIEVTIADLGNPVVFFQASQVGATGLEPRPEINGNGELLDRIEAVRQAAAEKIGLVQPGQVAKQVSPMKPLVVLFAEAASYKDYVSGEEIAADTMDFSARNIMSQMCIDTFAATAGLCCGVVAKLEGTVLSDLARKRDQDTVYIGHSRGIMDVVVRVAEKDGKPVVEKAVLKRTARRLMEGKVCINL